MKDRIDEKRRLKFKKNFGSKSMLRRNIIECINFRENKEFRRAQMNSYSSLRL